MNDHVQARPPTGLYTEAAEAAAVVQRQLERNRQQIAALGRKLRSHPPRLFVTCARGSSDHAATYARYLVETYAGLPTSSASPSISSVYGAKLKLEGSLCLAISQSGRSPDLLAMARAAGQNGAHVVALVNDAASPLAALAHDVIDLQAGAERSVAATKSFIATTASVVQLLAAWTGDRETAAASGRLPDDLAAAWQLDWHDAVPRLHKVRGLFVIGRGIGLGMAQEAALKFKEVCGIHAEAFSAAEVLHGPIAIANADFPALLLAQDDESLPGMQALAAELASRDIPVIAAGLHTPNALCLPTLAAHASVQPILQIQSFYRMVNELSLALGLDPDRPPYLSKITATV